jgi:predicted GH43/DUF377 family glycosyl hydrolase
VYSRFGKRESDLDRILLDGFSIVEQWIPDPRPLGAVLLDIDEPNRMIGHLPEPLFVAEEDERDGYVPNVVYSCGSLLHNGNVVIAYGASDRFTRFATVSLGSLLGALTAS